jgi:hypothetical protein
MKRFRLGQFVGIVLLTIAVMWTTWTVGCAAMGRLAICARRRKVVMAREFRRSGGGRSRNRVIYRIR